MVTIISSMEVKNVSQFKKSFETHEKMRTQSGIKVIGVHKSVDNENHVTVISEAATTVAAKTFMTNPEMKAVMEQAGVISQPDIKILTKLQ